MQNDQMANKEEQYEADNCANSNQYLSEHQTTVAKLIQLTIRVLSGQHNQGNEIADLKGSQI